MRNNFKITETTVLPDDLFGLENLKDVLMMEAWIEHLTPIERCDLHSFLPEGQKNNTVVEFLRSGENFNFGNPSLMWGASVCKGEQFPSALDEKRAGAETFAVSVFQRSYNIS